MGWRRLRHVGGAEAEWGTGGGEHAGGRGFFPMVMTHDGYDEIRATSSESREDARRYSRVMVVRGRKKWCDKFRQVVTTIDYTSSN